VALEQGQRLGRVHFLIMLIWVSYCHVLSIGSDEDKHDTYMYYILPPFKFVRR
jgi:hypothetical protein